MATNNHQGIAHIAHRPGGRPLCRHPKAHISVALADYRNGATNQAAIVSRRAWDRYCARCVAVVARMDAAKARNEASRADQPFPSRHLTPIGTSLSCVACPLGLCPYTCVSVWRNRSVRTAKRTARACTHGLTARRGFSAVRKTRRPDVSGGSFFASPARRFHPTQFVINEIDE